jgi:predicted RecB family nuclease
MYLLDEKVVVSASDLNAYTACRHLLRLNLEYARREREKPDDRDPTAEIVARKGDEHEARYLESLKAEGKSVVEIEQEGSDRASLAQAAAETLEAITAGAEVIYQATFFDGELRGHADFLFRVDRPSKLGDYCYEVADTKLARRAKPYFILQLCFYSELLARVQGTEPERIHVILGTNEQHSYRLAEFSAYYRRVRQRMLDDLAAGVPDTYPDPVEHCAICDWRKECDQRRIDDDHLSLVAWMPRLQIERLNAAGINTVAELATAPADLAVQGIREPTLAKLRAQAEIQFRGRERGERLVDLLQPEELRGFARLPEPSPGDIFFDLEGDPFFEDGLEYLWGIVTVDTGEPQFQVFWGRDRDEERQAFKQFIDFVWERRERFPDLHVYHYAHYELTVLKRLSQYYATREDELDQLLRDEVFVDLFKVVRESMRISEPGYGLKKVEGFYLEGREAELTDGEESIVMFEQWLDGGGLEGGDQKILDAIADYNEDDCVSTYLLRQWLLERRSEAESRFAQGIEWFSGTPEEPGEVSVDPETGSLIEALERDLPADPSEMDGDQRAHWLLAQMLGYHQREARPVWWMFFNRIDGDPDELIDDADCVAGLEADPGRPLEPVKQSQRLHMKFPPQEAKAGPGDGMVDTRNPRPGVTLEAIDAETGELTVRRGPRHDGNPPPLALIPGGPYTTNRQQNALRRLAHAVLDHGLDGDGPYRTCRDILLRRPPRLNGLEPGGRVQPETTEADDIAGVVAKLDEGGLFIQGPPGSGKTYKGARVICELIRGGNRVGVTSNSHKAIHNLLHEIEAVACADSVEFGGLKKYTEGNPESVYHSEEDDPRIGTASDNESLFDPRLALTAGTAWHYCHAGADQSLDYLFIDEAGQISLADTLALGTAARNIVLLGDPQQLPQVTQGAHPAGTGSSVLEHLLGDGQTIPPEEGIFLEQTYRMHPDVTALVSELMYEGRLESAPGRELQTVSATGEVSGAGIRWLPVGHVANTQSSIEEAERIAAAIEPLLEGGTYSDSDGSEHPLAPEDILVVTPYNAQVRCLDTRLPDGVRVGTVDKFQGQQAHAVFFSMATSSPTELPRNLEFLFSRNRLNVAISRARCIAAVVASPALLDTECRTIEQMRLVNALCRVVEIARDR